MVKRDEFDLHCPRLVPMPASSLRPAEPKLEAVNEIGYDQEQVTVRLIDLVFLAPYREQLQYPSMHCNMNCRQGLYAWFCTPKFLQNWTHPPSQWGVSVPKGMERVRVKPLEC